MKWKKLETSTPSETGEYWSNVPHRERLLVTNGEWIECIEEYGWDGNEYYFHNGTGKLNGVTHFAVFNELMKGLSL